MARATVVGNQVTGPPIVHKVRPPRGISSLERRLICTGAARDLLGPPFHQTLGLPAAPLQLMRPRPDLTAPGSTLPSSRSFGYPFVFASTTQPASRLTDNQLSKHGAKCSAEDTFSPTHLLPTYQSPTAQHACVISEHPG